MTQQPQPPLPASKLFIRSEVLSVIEFFTTLEDPPRQDKLKQLKRLSQIEDQDTVLKVLVKELQRAPGQPALQVIGELLMELGDIERLQEPLWKLIEAPDTTDEIKDAANLVLRQLGDQSDPSLYLDYLEDPEGLINRETERMLEVATRNPEALIDFIDFIFSLPVDEQCNLILSLQSDYPSDYLVNIYLPTLDAHPPYELTELMLSSLGQTKSRRAALYLEQIIQQDNLWLQDKRLAKAIQKSQNELKISGVYKENSPAYAPHNLIFESTLFECYATLPDGIGNQAIIISRKKENGDIAMMSVAINDMHGILDCFGFYQLSEPDFHKITQKFHEESSRIKVPPRYCFHQLKASEQLSAKRQLRIPYEYSCWKVLLDDVTLDHQDNQENRTPIDMAALCQEWANPKWHEESGSLYRHADFHTWFLEKGDDSLVNEVLDQVLIHLTQDALNNQNTPEQFLITMDILAETLIRSLLTSDWKDLLQSRLQQSAYLLHAQEVKTFSMLAATEAVWLSQYDPSRQIPLSGFMRQYGRRCIEEDLLRLKLDSEDSKALVPYIEHVLSAWELT